MPHTATDLSDALLGRYAEGRVSVSIAAALPCKSIIYNVLCVNSPNPSLYGGALWHRCKTISMHCLPSRERVSRVGAGHLTRKTFCRSRRTQVCADL